MRVGVFHWSFDELGGGEMLASYLAKALDTRVYSVIKDDKLNTLGFADISSHLPLVAKLARRFRSFDYLTWSSVDVRDFGDFDAVVTSGLTARALITPDDVMHVHYNHSPARWLYDLWHYRRKSKRWIKQNLILPLVSEFFRIWDASVDNRVDYYFSNSPITKRRLWKYLKRDSVVLYPPIEFDKYISKESEDFYLFVGRLWHEKKPEEAIRACIKEKKRIVVIGSGYLEKYLRDKYGNNQYVEIKGFVSEDEKIDLLSRCKAVIYPPIAEDFGIVPVEALASGKPVIVADTGFPPILLSETGFVNKNGVLRVYNGGIVTKGDETTIAIAIRMFDRFEWNSDAMREFAKRFDFSVFRGKLRKQLEEWYDEFTRI